MTVGASISNGRLSVHAGGKSYQILDTDPRFSKVVKLLKEGATESKLVEALDIVKHVEKVAVKSGMAKTVEFVDGVIKFNGETSANFMALRIVEHAKNNLPFKPLLNCFSRLMNNPSYRSREQFGKFMEHKSLPVTPEGMVLAYKAIRNDWTDKHTGKINNKIGAEITMDRGLIDDDPNSHCSRGLHVGSLEYVRGFANGGDRIVVVMFDPADAVSVPNDHNCTKMRVCKYTVVEEFKTELTGCIHNSDTSVYCGQTDHTDDGDDDYDADEVQSSLDEDSSNLCVNCNCECPPDDDFCSDDCEDEYNEEDYEDEDDVLPDNGKCCRGDCGSAKSTNTIDVMVLGKKPNGQNYHNVRNKLGRFAKKN